MKRTKGERREAKRRKQRDKMIVVGRSVKTLARILEERSKKLRSRVFSDPNDMVKTGHLRFETSQCRMIPLG